MRFAAFGGGLTVFREGRWKEAKFALHVQQVRNKQYLPEQRMMTP